MLGRARQLVDRARRRRQGSRRWLEQFYAQEYDPYHSQDNPYEASKFDDLLAALEGRRYRRTLEVGCAVGAFTARLADSCDALLAVDISSVAVERAKSRVAGLPHVRVEQGEAPQELPAGPFDLIVCSDVLYYLPARRMRRALDRLGEAVSPGGSLLSLHWLGDFGAPVRGDAVHDEQERAWAHFNHAVSLHREGVGPEGAGYRLDRYDRPLLSPARVD